MAKTYINGVFIVEKVFNDGGSILKLSVPSDKVDALAEQILANAKNGWTRLVIQKLREPKINTAGKTTATHSLSVDDWEPNQAGKPPQQRSQPAAKPAGKFDDVPGAGEPPESDDVPFN
jgi:hypothetical protein